MGGRPLQYMHRMDPDTGYPYSGLVNQGYVIHGPAAVPLRAPVRYRWTDVELRRPLGIPLGNLQSRETHTPFTIWKPQDWDNPTVPDYPAMHTRSADAMDAAPTFAWPVGAPDTAPSWASIEGAPVSSVPMTAPVPPGFLAIHMTPIVPPVLP